LHREAQRKYRRTEKGKKAHRQAENRRRHGQNQLHHKKMDDATSISGGSWDKGKLASEKCRDLVAAMEPRCHFCGVIGQIVGEFPRRGYG
jgi:hypothetical protein